MTASVDTVIGGIEIRLFANKSAYLPSEQTLLVSDTHLGKDATFRRHGIPVPQGPTDRTLQIIASALQETNAKSLVVLGDLFHAKSSLSKTTCQSLERFFKQHSSLSITLIRGNHDNHVGPLPASWPIKVLAPGATLGGVMLGHEPIDVPCDVDLFLCGHIHPAIRIAGMTGKTACFWHTRRQLVFPAMGDFTGTHVIEPQENDQVWCVAESEIIAMRKTHWHRSRPPRRRTV